VGCYSSDCAVPHNYPCYLAREGMLRQVCYIHLDRLIIEPNANLNPISLD
jgi:hypothetical protein